MKGRGMQNKFSYTKKVVKEVIKKDFVRHDPSDHQLAFYKELTNTTNHIILAAVAGSGKTTTIVESLELISTSKDIIFLAFNKSVVRELEARVPKTVELSTMHSLGCRSLMRFYGKIKISENKIIDIALKLFNTWNVQKNDNKFLYCYRIKSLVDIMRCTLTTENDVDIEALADMYSISIFGEEVKHAKEVLAKSNKDITTIDFADMIYQTAVRNIKMKKYDFVFVDELQDLNKAQQAIILKIIKPKVGRFIGVGDENQSIYGFAGADFESFQRMKTMMPNTIELPLSVCYRSTKEIVIHAQELFPQMQYYDKAEQGTPPREGKFSELRSGDFVGCRNTKPLVVAFIQLLKQGKKANIKGKEIGKNLATIINRTGQKSTKLLIKHLDVEKIKLKRKLLDRGVKNIEENEKMITMTERIEIIKILSEGLPSVKMLVEYIDKIFLDEDLPGIVLSTIHKLKGLEADRVFVLCQELMPSKYAKQPHDKIQEKNLMYVLRTRAKKDLIYITDFNPEDYKTIEQK